MLARSAAASLVLVAAAAQDPAAKFQADLTKTLAAHPFFSRVEFVVETKHAPFLFLVQKPPKEDPEHVRKVVNSVVPFLAELSRVFEDEYRKPLELVRSPDAPLYAIAVLASHGSYVDFSRAVGEAGLHSTRAHYDPRVRIAVTYEDTFAASDPNPEERHALLHEFIHALQHAHSGTGKMPKPAWFNEGLADYRASSTNMAESLRAPPLDERHLKTLAFAYGNPAGVRYVLPIAELAAASSYREVVELAQKRGGVQGNLALAVFYAQSAMFVRFLHEGAEKKHREGFQRYFRAVIAGEDGLPAFQQAFAAADDEALAKLEQEYLTWLDGQLRPRYPKLRNLAGGGDGSGPAPLAPPAAFDPAVFAWRAEENEARLQGARRLCMHGAYEQARELLPAVGSGGDREPLLQRERARIDTMIALRDAALADVEQKKAVFALKVDDPPREIRGKLVRREGDVLVLLVGKQEEKVPLAAMTPAVLLREGNRLKRFEGKERWQEAWLRWLCGHKRAALKGLFDLGYTTLGELKQDLEVDLDEGYGAAAACLAQLQRVRLPDDAGAARAELAAFEALVRPHRTDPLLASRMEHLEELARALAERAFSLDDPAAAGVRGKSTVLSDGRVRITYPDPGKVQNADFTLVPKGKDDVEAPVKLAYDGPTQVKAGKDHWKMIGSGSLRWPVALAGKQEIELEFQLSGQGLFMVLLCHESTGALAVQMNGTVLVLDEKSGIFDEVGKSGDLWLEKNHKLRIVHDGQKRLEVFFDGKRTAEVGNVGGRLRGDLRLQLHSSNEIMFRNLSITGRLDPNDPQPLREKFVEDVLARLRAQ